jgi:outer membrane protein
MPRTTLLASVVCSLAALSGAAQAQSLNELYEAARAYDASYLASRAAADSVQYRLTQAQALKKPTLGLGSSVTHSQVDPPTVYASTAAGQVKVAGDRVGSTTVQAGLSASYSLYNRASGVTISQAERAVEVARAELEIAEQDLMVRVAQAYFDVLAAREALATAQAAKKATAEQLASAKRNFEVGTATITDTREAQARFDRGLATELAAENDLRVKRVTLDQLVGRVDVSPKPLAVPVALPAVEPLAVEPWLQRAEEGHPQLRRARLGLEVAQLEIDKARAGNAPTLDLTGSLGGQDASGRGASPKGFTSSASVGVQFKIAALHRRRHRRAHQGNPGPGRALAQRCRVRTPHGGREHQARLPVAAVPGRPGAGLRVGRGQQQAGARSHAARLSGRRARQPRRAQRPGAVVRHAERSGQGALRQPDGGAAPASGLGPAASRGHRRA